MINIILIVFFIINLINVIRKKNNLIIDIYSFFTFWILFALNFNNADYINYENRYINSLGGDGFILDLIMRYLNRNNWSYSQFLSILSFLGLFLIFLTIRKLSLNRSFVYLCYLVYPFFLDVVQIKNFMLHAIIVYVIADFIKTSRIKKNLALITISLGFHIAAIFYYPLILFSKKMTFKLMYLVSYISFSLLFLINIRILKVEKILFFIPEWKQIAYTTNFSRLGWIIFVTLQIFTLLLFLKNTKKINIQLNYDYFLLKKICVFSTIYLGLYLINGTFERIFRNLLMLIYIHLSNIYIIKKEKKILIDLTIIIVVHFFIYLFKFKDTVVYPVLKDNYLNYLFLTI